MQFPPSNEHDPLIQKYIFPGFNQPKLSEIASLLERNYLAILDVENIIRHYHPTAARWLNRFQVNKGQLESGKYDTVLQKMWKYYFSCAAGRGGCFRRSRFSSSICERLRRAHPAPAGVTS
jgi:cyclopropane-fatty-acyl-phospholipid synthase